MAKNKQRHVVQREENLKISVIIPTYNRDNILPMAIENLLKQEYERSDFEIIVVDNNSKDKAKIGDGFIFILKTLFIFEVLLEIV